jgi:hypothetical protein
MASRVAYHALDQVIMSTHWAGIRFQIHIGGPMFKEVYVRHVLEMLAQIDEERGATED